MLPFGAESSCGREGQLRTMGFGLPSARDPRGRALEEQEGCGLPVPGCTGHPYACAVHDGTTVPSMHGGRWREEGGGVEAPGGRVTAPLRSLVSLGRMEEAAAGQGRRALHKRPGGPPWRETYRQRCIQRMKSSRARLLDKYRRVGEIHTGLMAQEVMEEEWMVLQSTYESPVSQRHSQTFAQVEDPDELAVLEEIQQELMSQEQAFIEEYERSLRFEDDCFRALLEGLQTDSLVCPVCARHNLTVMRGTVLCQCGLRLVSQAQELTEQTFRALLEESLNRHSEFCTHRPEFSITSETEENASLLLSCVVCDTWTVLL